MPRPNHVLAWRNEDDRRPMRPEAKSIIGRRNVGDVLRVVRNALAHGNVIYPDETGFARRGAKLQLLALEAA